MGIHRKSDQNVAKERVKKKFSAIFFHHYLMLEALSSENRILVVAKKWNILLLPSRATLNTKQ